MQIPTDEQINNVLSAMSELTTGAAIMSTDVEVTLYGDDWMLTMIEGDIQCSQLWCKRAGAPGHWKDMSDLVDAHKSLELALYEAILEIDNEY
jgi:hypothetical protein